VFQVMLVLGVCWSLIHVSKMCRLLKRPSVNIHNFWHQYS